MGSMFSKLFLKSKSQTKTDENSVQQLDYEKMILLDAEDLAEQGIDQAYQRVLPELAKYVTHPVELTEIMDTDLPSYKIRCNGQEYLIYSAEEPDTERESWGRAAYAFFHVVNKQLVGTGVQLYAINNGNDLGGLFLTPEEAKSAQEVILRKTDWPYIPEPDEPWYGQFH